MLKYILLSIHLLCISSFAQESLGKVEDFFKVDEIQVVGVKKVEPEAVTEKVSLKEGSMATNYSIREAIKSIYDLKYFEVVEAHHIKKDGKNVLQFKVKEKPILTWSVK